MNPAALLPRHGGGNQSAARDAGHDGANAGVGLWVFIGVASTLFSLFIVAYVMRMSERDAVSIGLPWQLWLSSAWLLAGSICMHIAATRATAEARVQFLIAGACLLAFVVVQAWSWRDLAAAQVSVQGNPGASFFFLLTAMHGLHVAGGLVAWAVALRAMHQDADTAGWRIALCARYWHFLLAVWLLLFASLALITPEVAGFICGTR